MKDTYTRNYNGGEEAVFPRECACAPKCTSSKFRDTQRDARATAKKLWWTAIWDVLD